MTQVQQAVFTWTQNEQAAGYQLAGASDGLSASDCRELACGAPGTTRSWSWGRRRPR